MATIYVGSARHDENGKLVNGKSGDQLQKSTTNDTVGEVSMQPMYTHSKGWLVLRPKKVEYANRLADAMVIACNNKHIGYDQNQRTGIVTKGIRTTTDTECDCSSLVRTCIKEVYGTDVGNFTTATEVSALEKSGLFEKAFTYVKQSTTPVYDGDVLVTKTKGHTVIVVKGNPRKTANYYPQYKGLSVSIVTALGAVGEKDTTLTHRKKIASANGMTTYTGTAVQNTQLLVLLKQGKLVKP